MMSLSIEDRLKKSAAEFEEYFEKYFSYCDEDLKRVTDAMRYSAMSGGKRIRPFIVLEICEMLGGKSEAAMPLACALECVHTYSLIHDDLPCMDNDDFRRGRPTCHKVYGEEFALLAGDALLTYAFEIIADAKMLDERAKLEAVKLLAASAGILGMVGGQTIDLESEGNQISLEKLLKLHSLKTGALIRCAAGLGALAAGADDVARRDVDKYAEKTGLAFQIADDILDVTADEKELGKPVGSDAQNKKVTFMTFMSLEEAKEYAASLADEAKKYIGKYDKDEIMCSLADYIVSRRK
ncbi:MAG: polyprenyl synthetase family protein [Ruminococcaceae bacterium]|nr:polyprenyl synthetase family protein [Oscillospiraceae bacterium]